MKRLILLNIVRVAKGNPFLTGTNSSTMLQDSGETITKLQPSNDDIVSMVLEFLHSNT
jgi:hypothetical protein